MGPHGIRTNRSLDELLNADPNCKRCFGNGFMWDGQVCDCCTEFWDEWEKDDVGIETEDLRAYLDATKSEEKPLSGKMFKCLYCGYECPIEELGVEFDCPNCGDN